jgi:hypothetical protein
LEENIDHIDPKITAHLEALRTLPQSKITECGTDAGITLLIDALLLVSSDKTAVELTGKLLKALKVNKELIKDYLTNIAVAGKLVLENGIDETRTIVEAYKKQEPVTS